MGRESAKTKRVGNGVSVYEGKRKKALRINFTFKGVLCRETLSLQPTPKNIKFATNYLGSIHDEISRENFDYAAHFPKSKRALLFCGVSSTSRNVGEALDVYLNGRKPDIEASTYRDYASAINCHLKDGLGNIQLKDLSTEQIRIWKATLVISKKRIANILVPLRCMLQDAFEEGHIKRNPMDRIKIKKIEVRQPEPFLPEERVAILEELEKLPQSKNLVQFAFWSGVRTSELIAIDWEDIDWIKGTIRIVRANVRSIVKYPKTDAGIREIILLPSALEALKAQKEFSFLEGGRIFRRDWDNQPWLNDNQLSKRMWIFTLKKAGVRHRGIYHTRHTYASILLTSGENPAWIAKQMGHATVAVLLKRYARWIPEEDPGLKARLEEKFGGKSFKTTSKVS
jgi:integrase